MNWKNRLTNYNFWISLVSAVLLIMQAFNFEFDIANLSEIATALLGLLVVIGIISNPTKSNSQPKEEAKPENSKDENQSTDVNVSNGGIKENFDSMPSGEQNEDNSGIGEDDFKVLIEKISSDIASETGIMKENVANVVNEIIKTYEEGEFMLETENKEVENSTEEIIENETSEQIENNLDEIAEELLEKEDIEINEELADTVEEEYIEFKTIEKEEELITTKETPIEEEEVLIEIEHSKQDENEKSESIEEVLDSVQEQIEEKIEQEKNETQEEPIEEVVSFKIVN